MTIPEGEIDRGVCEAIAGEIARRLMDGWGLPGLGRETVAREGGDGTVVVWAAEMPQHRYIVEVTPEPKP
jgi:hypothetical protein